MAIQRADCVQLGYISKAHGVRGELKATFDVYDLQEYLRQPILWMAKPNEPLEEVKVLQLRPQSGKLAILKVEGVDSRDDADAWVGKQIFFPVEALPELPAGHFYYFQVIGFTVEDAQLGTLGTVRDFADGQANDILIMDYQEQEVLIPVTDAFVLRADFEQEIVYTNLPDGLLDMYLE